MKTLLITPPFTQLNTPYPATAYLKGYLDKKGFQTEQLDLSILLFLKIFSQSFLEQVLSDQNKRNEAFPDIRTQKQQYIKCIDTVISFLQSPTTVKAHLILAPQFLPKNHRFNAISAEDMDYAFGDMGIIDKAKHFATLLIEELGDYIADVIDPDFGFTKYAEKIARTATSFQPIEEKLTATPSIIVDAMIEILEENIMATQPDIIGLTIPFPGNLYAALRCAKHIKIKHPSITVAFGGGYCNTELRSLKDTTIFKYVDFISLDDGELAFEKIINWKAGKVEKSDLIRTYYIEDKKLCFSSKSVNLKHEQLPTPTYKGLPLEKYVSFLDVLNPMHRKWSDGRWNKLTVAHGCYWAQCSFCDVGLDYIGRYENTTAEDLVNKMEELINETGDIGFHFVDEAAPPKMLRALSQEILKRNLNVVWWVNIRFEKTFNPELCELMAKAGCIAVTGGLEVASDRLLKLMKKGVSIEQVAGITKSFSNSGILVHAYLMYGFPTETAQETIDSLEVVRQLFESNCIQSGFWHLFTATAHSPVGLNPKKYKVKITGPKFEGFADNDLFHDDPTGTHHEKFSDGLKIALYNYMNSTGFDIELSEWFNFKTPATKLPPNLIWNYIN